MKSVADVLDLRAVRSMQLLCNGYLDVVGLQFGPASCSPSGAGCFKVRFGALGDKIVLKLCQHRDELENSMPVGVLVLTSSVSDTKLMFRFFNFSSVSMSCCNDRPSQSNFHTTRVSPSFRYAMAARNALRSKRTPVCLSVKTLTTPRFFKASNWRAR